MKRILFVIPEYSHGGTNKSLENLLYFLDKGEYDISVYCLYEDGGDYYKKIFAPYIIKKSCLYYWLHDNACTRKIMGLYNKLTKRDHFSFLYKHEACRLEAIYKFDAVIAYQEGTATEFVSYFKKTKKIAWIHFDYAMLTGKVDLMARKVYYDAYQQIVCVSKTALKSMLAIHPEYRSKSTYIYNTLNTYFIKEASDKDNYIPYEHSAFNIISIGRFVEDKQFHEIPKIANYIRRRVHNPFCWYIIGSGEYEERIRSEIDTYSVSDIVKILGSQDNPYPYICQANLLVCLSMAESFSYVIAEAKVLHTPVLSNDFPVASEVLDKSIGWISNIKDMSRVLINIIDNIDGEYDKKKTEVMKFEYSNEKIMQKVEQIL